MKKRIITFLSVILAFVLCFSLVACGNENKPNDPNDPSNPNKPAEPSYSVNVGDTLDAFKATLTTKSWKGTASYSLKNGTLTDSKTVGLDKRNNMLQVKNGDDLPTYFDLSTGYAYYQVEGKMFADGAVLPQGLVDNIFYLTDSFVTADARKVNVQVDAQKKATYSFDLADKANAVLNPLYEAYEKEQKLSELLDTYTTAAGMGNYADIVATVKQMVAANEDTTLDMLATMMDINLNDILAQMGYLPNEIAAFKARKVGEMVAGLNDFITTMMSGQQPAVQATEGGEGDREQQSNPGMSEMLDSLINCLIYLPYTKDQVTQGLESFNAMIDAVNDLQFNAVVNMLFPAVENPDGTFTDSTVVAFLKDKATFQNIKAEIVLTYDDSKNLTAVTVTGTIKNTSKLIPNDLMAQAAFAVTEYVASPTPFDVQYDKTLPVEYTTRAVVINKLDGSDVKLTYLVSQNFVQPTVMMSDEQGEPMDTTGLLTINAEKNEVTINGAKLKTLFGDNAVFGDMVNIELVYGEYDYALISVVYINNNAEQFGEYMGNMISEIISNIGSMAA